MSFSQHLKINHLYLSMWRNYTQKIWGGKKGVSIIGATETQIQDCGFSWQAERGSNEKGRGEYANK